MKKVWSHYARIASMARYTREEGKSSRGLDSAAASVYIYTDSFRNQVTPHLMRLTVLEYSQPRRQDAPALENGPRSIGAVRVLRLSLTDRCNFRCVYCMPADGVPWIDSRNLLSFDEITDVVRAAIQIHGIRRFKLTGGEPTVRPRLVELVHQLKNIDGVDDLSLTTNGQLLAELARPLHDAGLDRVTVSVDSLDAVKFRQITRSGDLPKVLAGLDACLDAGFNGTKVNCVTMRGTNDDEVADFARLTVDRPITVRFIEYMPLGDASLLHEPHGSPAAAEIGPAGGCGAQDRGPDALIPESEVRARIEDQCGPLVPVPRDSEPGVGPAVVYRLGFGNPRGRIGFISSMSAPFCATCNRLRLTADGVLRSCLFDGGEIDIRPILRGPRTRHLPRDLADAMTACVRLKPDLHSTRGNKQMSQIGG
jgi:cyclic pyranopterin phosphate synthase